MSGLEPWSRVSDGYDGTTTGMVFASEPGIAVPEERRGSDDAHRRQGEHADVSRTTVGATYSEPRCTGLQVSAEQLRWPKEFADPRGTIPGAVDEDRVGTDSCG